MCQTWHTTVTLTNQFEKRTGTIFISRTGNGKTRKLLKEQRRLSLYKFFYVLGAVWFVSGLLALQSALISVTDQSSSAYQSVTPFQDRQTLQSGDPAGRGQSNTLSAPVRAILTPALYFSSKALPFSGDGTCIVSALVWVFAAFSALRFALTFCSPLLPAHITALRARAPPASSCV